MEEKNTPESSKKEVLLSPKQSTIEFLRLFARIYTCNTGHADDKGLVLN